MSEEGTCWHPGWNKCETQRSISSANLKDGALEKLLELADTPPEGFPFSLPVILYLGSKSNSSIFGWKNLHVS